MPRIAVIKPACSALLILLSISAVPQEAARADVAASDPDDADAYDGWILGESVGSPGVDQPCVVRLLSNAIEIDVHPQTLLPEPERITAPFANTMVGSRRFGRSVRLAVAFDTLGRRRS